MSCPNCGKDENRVIDCRPAKADIFGDAVKSFRRRRECECGHRFNTYELTEDDIETMQNSVRMFTAEALRNFADLFGEGGGIDFTPKRSRRSRPNGK